MYRLSRNTSIGSATLLLCIMTLVLTTSACGRSASRALGKSAPQVLEVKDMAPDGFISLSMRNEGDATIKDVTFRATDGEIYTQEFRDWHMLQGRIHWVASSHMGSLIRSRSITRVFGGSVDLSVPDDCVQVLQVLVQSGTKDLVYRNKDGMILSKEYRDGMGGRFAEGWLEVKSKG